LSLIHPSFGHAAVWLATSADTARIRPELML